MNIRIMNIKPGLFAVAAAALVAGTAGCGTAADTGSAGSSTPATSSTSATSTPSRTSSPSTTATASTTTTASATATSPGTARAARPSTAQPVLLRIKNFTFTKPKPVAHGAKVMVTNADSQAHTVTSKLGSFDVTVNGGDKATFTAPTKPGRYPFVCTFHAGMSGTLVVT